MAVSLSKEGKAYLEGIMDGIDDSSCFQMVNPSLDDAEDNQHYCIDVLPVLENSSFPAVMLNAGSHGQNVYNFSVVPDDGITVSKCPTEQAFMNYLQVPQQSPMCLVAEWDCKTCSILEYSDCSLEVDIDNETTETPKTYDGTVGESTESEGASERVSRWMNGLEIGGKITQALMNHFSMQLKCSSKDKSNQERGPDTPKNRCGRYKRSASFNSRRVAFLFSTLSSIGTIVLIYLTLRVKLINDALIHE
ncbi:hypothetical protein C5167_008228 [Papaver somniferum]|uniref:Uncharacterized protein n=2 Tax=Papaver somniferum TaxID=3469 RepID=A0A4Y7JV08_PAPSO|nr:hypothetical protein C5167_008228 [Papaver somniferum]